MVIMKIGSGIKQLGPECNMIQLSSIAGTLYDAKRLAGIRSIVQRISVIWNLSQNSSLNALSAL